MAVDHRLQKLFGNFRGIDKRSSDLSRDSEFATEIKMLLIEVLGQ